MEGTIRAPITLFPLQIITKKKKKNTCSIRDSALFVITEGQFV